MMPLLILFTEMPVDGELANLCAFAVSSDRIKLDCMLILAIRLSAVPLRWGS